MERVEAEKAAKEAKGKASVRVTPSNAIVDQSGEKKAECDICHKVVKTSKAPLGRQF